VGYRYPHDFEDADVDQQYLPDELKDRRYYLPTDQGYEATLANRMAARTENRSAGRAKKSALPKPDASHGAGDGLLKTREANRKELADTEKRDAQTD